MSSISQEIGWTTVVEYESRAGCQKETDSVRETVNQRVRDTETETDILQPWKETNLIIHLWRETHWWRWQHHRR